MGEEEEECELQQLVPAEEDNRLSSACGEITPPTSPVLSKINETSPAPAFSKMSSASGEACSVKGAHSQASSSSRSLSRIATVPSVLSGHASTNNSGTRFLYINEKLGPRPSRPPHPPPPARPHGIKRVAPLERPVHHHCFLSDVTDVRRMETALLRLLEDFHSGKLRAFGKDCSMEQMTGIREQQERLARLHFELGAQQELFAPLSQEGLRQGTDNMAALMASLEQLSESIERLHSFSSQHD